MTTMIPDPTAALLLSSIKRDELGQLYHGGPQGVRSGLRRRRRRFEHAARIRRLLA